MHAQPLAATRAAASTQLYLAQAAARAAIAKGLSGGLGKERERRVGEVSLTGLLLPFVVWLLVLYLVSNSLDRKNGLVLTLIGVNISSDCPPWRPLLYRRRLRTTLVRLLLLLLLRLRPRLLLPLWLRLKPEFRLSIPKSCASDIFPAYFLFHSCPNLFLSSFLVILFSFFLASF